jgi:hypothetical protein
MLLNVTGHAVNKLYKNYTYIYPHITKPTHTHTYTLQKPTATHTHTLQNPQIHTPTHHKFPTYSHSTYYKQLITTTVQVTHQIIFSQYNKLPSVFHPNIHGTFVPTNFKVPHLSSLNFKLRPNHLSVINSCLFNHSTVLPNYIPHTHLPSSCASSLMPSGLC